MLYSWFSEIAAQIGVLHDFTISDPIVVQTAKVFLSANGEGFSEGSALKIPGKVNLVRENKKNCRTSPVAHAANSFGFGCAEHTLVLPAPLVAVSALKTPVSRNLGGF